MTRPAFGLFLTLALTAPAAADPVEQAGTVLKYALPLAAAACAVDQGRAEDFAVRGLVQIAVVWALKGATDGTPLGRRPNGEGRGFPSGHTASSAFGAADLAGKCFADDPALGAAAYGAAAFTGWSRWDAGQHTPGQIAAGGLIGLSFGAADFGIGTDGVSVSFGMKF